MMLKALGGSACCPPQSRAARSAASVFRSLAACRPSARPIWVPRSAPEEASTSVDASSQGEATGGEILDDKERARRQKISQANTGRTPWNKGKKHSQGGKLIARFVATSALEDSEGRALDADGLHGCAETIAKIRERTIEAMARTEIVEKVKAGLAARQQVHSAETRVRWPPCPRCMHAWLLPEPEL
jgi:hypothetical protein